MAKNFILVIPEVITNAGCRIVVNTAPPDEEGNYEASFPEKEIHTPYPTKKHVHAAVQDILLSQFPWLDLGNSSPNHIARKLVGYTRTRYIYHIWHIRGLTLRTNMEPNQQNLAKLQQHSPLGDDGYWSWHSRKVFQFFLQKIRE